MGSRSSHYCDALRQLLDLDRKTVALICLSYILSRWYSYGCLLGMFYSSKTEFDCGGHTATLLMVTHSVSGRAISINDHWHYPIFASAA